jgi:RNA polymerase primary sigma factor
MGNANALTIPFSLATEVREAVQNSKDAHDGRSKSVIVRFSLIELRGQFARTFLDAARWSELRPHVEAATHLSGKSKLARLLREGLQSFDEATESAAGPRVTLMRVDDFGTRGLTGDETGEGSYAALVRNNLDSTKGSKSSGGSFGLGKASHWICSNLSTVYFNSVTSDRRSRVIARSELTHHALAGGIEYQGTGWFGRDDAGVPVSIDDQDLAERLQLARHGLSDDLRSRIQSDHGTSVLVVGFRDPEMEDEPTWNSFRDGVMRSAAVNFWPAMVRGDLSVVVDHLVDGQVIDSRTVDPIDHVPEYCRMYRAFRDRTAVHTLANVDDVAKRSIAIEVPATKRGDEDGDSHGPVEGRVTLLVSLDKQSANEQGRTRPSPRGGSVTPDSDRLNCVALVRGPGMVVQYQDRAGVAVAARPFRAVVLAGAFAEDHDQNARVDRFLRAAEPPAHDSWADYGDVKALYARGGRSKIERFLRTDVTNALRELLVARRDESSDGPPEFKKLLALGGSSRGAQASYAELKGVPEALLKDGAWVIRATIALRQNHPGVRVAPRMTLQVEVGKAAELDWTQLSVQHDDRVQRDGESWTFVVPAGVGRFNFEGRARPRDQLLALDRCVAQLFVTSEAL